MIQPRLSVAKRANNLSILGDMIQQEAQRTPAPDLIVLPDCCVSTQETNPQVEVTVAMCQGFAEAFAWWAREWGVWIAVGHSTRIENQLQEVATLFDPDGDPFIRARDPSDDAAIVENIWAIQNTPIGRIALSSWNAPSMEACQPIESKPPPDLLIIPALHPNRAAIETMAKNHACYAVSTGCVLDDSSPTVQSFAADRDGKILAETSPGKASTALVAVDVEPRQISDDEWEATELIE
jgi:predicted amidohydrolase